MNLSFILIKPKKSVREIRGRETKIGKTTAATLSQFGETQKDGQQKGDERNISLPSIQSDRRAIDKSQYDGIQFFCFFPFQRLNCSKSKIKSALFELDFCYETLIN